MITSTESCIFALMKVIKLIFAIVLGVLFVACDHAPKNMPVGFTHQIRMAEAKWDSVIPAREYLKKMEKDTLRMGMAEKMYFKLKQIYLNDKASDTCISVDKAMQLVAYYESYGPDSLYLEAMYYLGGAYRDHKDYPQAVYWYNKAQHLAEENKELQKLILYTRICSQGGDIYNRLYLGRKAIEMYKKGLNGNQNRIVSAIYEGLGYTYSNIGKPNSALYYFEKVYYSDLLPDDYKKNVYRSILSMIFQVGDDKAIKKYAKGLLGEKGTSCNKDELAFLMYVKGGYYMYLGNTDKACEYFHKACDTDDDDTKQNAYLQLMKIYFKKKNYAEAEKYTWLYQQQVEDAFHNTESAIASQTEDLYNYQFQQKQRIEAEAEKKIANIWWGIVVSCVLLVFAGVWWYYRKNKRKLKAKVNQYQGQIGALSSDLEKERASLTQVQEQLEEEKLKIEELRTQIETHQQNAAGLENLLDKIQKRRKDSFPDLREKLSNQTTAIDGNLWFTIKQVLRVTFPNLEDNIQKRIGTLSDFDQKYVNLLCFGLRDTNIAQLLSVSPQNLWGHKKRLYTRMTGKEKFDKDHFGKLMESLMK